MTSADIAVVFDTSALLAYVDGHIAVGELLSEVADEGRRVGVPAACLGIARASIEDDLAAAHLLLITTSPNVTVLPLGPDERDGATSIWRVGELARVAGGDLGAGHAAYSAMDLEAYLATMRPAEAAALMPRGWSVIDLR